MLGCLLPAGLMSKDLPANREILCVTIPSGEERTRLDHPRKCNRRSSEEQNLATTLMLCGKGAVVDSDGLCGKKRS